MPNTIQYLEIDDIKREINVPVNLMLGVYGDKNVERVHFRVKKLVGDNIDLARHQIYVKYIATLDVTGESYAEGQPDMYYCDDVTDNGDTLTFSWKMGANVFKSAGFIAFSVLASDGEATRWNTRPAIGTVKMTIPGGLPEVTEKYPDVITQLLNRMENLEFASTFSGDYNDLRNKPEIPAKLPNPNAITFTGAVTGSYDGSQPLTIDIPQGGSGAVNPQDINKAVNDYLSKNPVQSTPVDASFTKSNQAADAKAVGDYLGRMQDGGIIVPPPEPPQPPVEPQPQVPSVNLFDKSKAESGRYEASNGQHVAGSDYMTITLPYKHGDVIRKSKDVSWFTTWILLCDSAKNPIISQVNVVPGNDFTNPGWDEWKMPENIYSLEPKYAQAKYIKVGVSIHGTIKDFSQFMVTINNPLPDHYVPPTSGDVSTASATASAPTFVYSATLDEHIKSVASGITGEFDGRTLIFIGDSIFEGIVQEQGAPNLYQKHGFIEMLQAKYPKANFKNLAKGGATLATFVGATIPSVGTQITNAISQYPNADYVIIEGGINDTWATSKIQLGTVSTGYNAPLDESTFCGALESIFKKAVAQYTGKKIGFVVAHKVPSSPNWVQYSDKTKEICKKWSIPYLDLYNESTLNYALDSVKSGFSYHTSQHPQGDGLHPNEKCYEQIYVPKIESWLRRL